MPRTAPTSDFWNRLTALPGYSGLTQTAIAKKASRVTGEKIGQSGVQKWKAGTALPSLAKVQDLAKDAGVSIEYFFPTGIPKEPHDKQLDELIEVWQYLGADARNYILGAVKLERAMQFTGDNNKRSAYQRDLVRLTESQQRYTDSILERKK